MRREDFEIRTRKTQKKEEAEELTGAMEGPEEYRQVIMLRSWERLPFAKVGKQLDRSEAAAGKLWSRAMERRNGSWKHLMNVERTELHAARNTASNSPPNFIRWK